MAAASTGYELGISGKAIADVRTGAEGAAGRAALVGYLPVGYPRCPDPWRRCGR